MATEDFRVCPYHQKFGERLATVETDVMAVKGDIAEGKRDRIVIHGRVTDTKVLMARWIGGGIVAGVILSAILTSILGHLWGS